MSERAIPKSLVENIDAGRAALIVGAGIERGLWARFAGQMMQQLPGEKASGNDAAEVADLVGQGDLARAVGFLVRRLGPGAASESMAQALEAGEAQPELEATVKLLARLPFRRVWNTCPGAWLHRALVKERPAEWPDLIAIEPEPGAALPPEGCALITPFDDLILSLSSPRAARDALARAPELREHLQSLYTQGSLVLVGFDHGDPDLELILEQVFGSFDPPRGEHYLVVPEQSRALSIGAVDADELAHAHRITIVRQTDYLQNLAQACEVASNALAQMRPPADDLDGWLGRWPQEPDAARQALADMAESARQSGDSERLAQVLTGWVNSDERERAPKLFELAEVLEHQVGDLAKAFVALIEALKEDPTGVGALDEIERLADAIENWADVVVSVSEIANGIDDSTVAASYWLRLGSWYEVRLGHVESAISSYRRAADLQRELGLHSDRSAAYRALAGLYGNQERWGELADVLAEHADAVTDPSEARALYLALGELCETELGATERALEAYRAAAALDDEGDGDARDGESNADEAPRSNGLAALERMHRRHEQWSELVEVLGEKAQALATVNAQRAAAVRREIAALKVSRLGDREGAIVDYEAALDLDPDEPAELDTLAELYRGAGRIDDYVRVLEMLIDFLPEAEQSAPLLRLARDIEERDQAKAMRCYERIAVIERTGATAEDAFLSLARLQRDDGAWEQLASTLIQHLEIARDIDARMALYMELAAVYEDEQDDPHRAIEQYLHAREIDRYNRDCALALGRLFGRTEAWERAIAVLVEQAEHEDDPALWYEAGRLVAEHLDQLGVMPKSEGKADNASARRPELGSGNGAAEPGADPAALAERYLAHAIDLDPKHRDAMLALAKLDEIQGRWASAAEYLLQAKEHAASRRDRVALMTSAAELLANRLGESERALELWLQVLEIDPDNREIGLLAAEALAAAGRYDEAIPIFAAMSRRSADPVDRAELEVRIGRAHEALGDSRQAVECYRQALQRDSDNHDAALGLANVLFATAQGECPPKADNNDNNDNNNNDNDAEMDPEHLARWREVEAQYRDFLERHSSGLVAKESAIAWYRVGLAQQAMADHDSADYSYRQALSRDPIHQASLAALVDVARRRGDWHTVIENKRVQIEATLSKREYEGEARLLLLSEIGDIYREELHDSTGALAAYQEALEIDSSSRLLLGKLLDLHVDKADWGQAFETLSTLAKNAESDSERAECCYRAAAIARDHMAKHDLAIAKLEQVLDADPASETALSEIDQLLSERGDYRTLAGIYRKLLTRLGNSAALESLLPLWSRLGEICRDYLDRDTALAALEVAASLDPDNPSRREELVDLYLLEGGSRRDDAIEQLQQLLHDGPERIELYRALSDLYIASNHADKAFCLARALVFLGAAEPQDIERFERSRPTELVATTRHLSEQLWRTAIVHPDEDHQLNAVFGTLCGAISALSAQPASAYDLRSGDRAEPNRPSTRTVARVLDYVAEILAIKPIPDLYLRDDVQGIRIANIRQDNSLVPSLLVGRPQRDSNEEAALAFQLGKRLAYLRPERYPHQVLETVPQLETALAAALAASGADVELPIHPPDSTWSRETRELIEHFQATVPDAVLEKVAAMAPALAPSLPANGTMSAWRAAADLTADRVGFILCNDFETAARLIATEPAGQSTLSAKERLLDLLLYSVSEPYFEVRRHLGLAVISPNSGY